jgi:hypothetical protein
MDLKEEVAQLRQTGMEKAAGLWEMFQTLPTPIAPVNIYKAACSIKCAEFLARIRNNSLYFDIARQLTEFMDETLRIAEGEGTKSDMDEGFRAIKLMEREMPLTGEIFDDAAAYATRQHVYDGVIVLAAARMGKETEVKECIENLQKGVGRAMVTAIFRAALLEAADETPDNE